jgi:hypothetical protein
MVVIQTQLMDINYKAKHRSMSHHKSIRGDYGSTSEQVVTTALEEIENL